MNHVLGLFLPTIPNERQLCSVPAGCANRQLLANTLAITTLQGHDSNETLLA